MMVLTDEEYFNEVDKQKEAAAPTAAPAASSPATPSAPASSLSDEDYWAAVDRQKAGSEQQTPPQPQTTLRGVARNAAVATAEDVPANLLNVFLHPVENLLYLPMLTAGAAGHDFLARNIPSLGIKELTPDDRKALFEDFSNQEGNKIVSTVAHATGIPDQSEVAAATPTERLIRKGVGAAEMGAMAAPGVSMPLIAGASAVAADQAAQSVPAPYKQAVEMGVNIAGNTAGAMATNAVRPTTPSLPETEIMQMAKDRGIDLPAPQGSLGQLSQNTPFSGAPMAAAKATSQWRTKVSNLIGENTDRITQGTINAADARTGAVMDRVEQNPVRLDNTYQGIAAQIESDAIAEFGAGSQQYNRVQHLLNNTISAVQADGTIPGGTYAALIHKGSPLDNAIRGRNSDIGTYGTRIKEGLQDALQRSVTPDEAAAYQQARQQYAITRMIEPLTQQAGRAAIAGEIDPTKFLVAARNNAPSNSEAMNLARIGQMIPQSGARTAIGEAITAGEMAKVMGPKLLAAFPPALLANRLLASKLRNPGMPNSGSVAAFTNPLLINQSEGQ